MQVKNCYSGSWDCFMKTYKQNGVPGVFKGLGVTGVRDFLGYGLYFATYEALTRSSPGGAPVGTASMLLAGGLSGTVSWIFTYPLDVVKTRLQIDAGKYSSFADCLKKSVQSEGLMCLSRGLTPTLIRAFPTNAVTFTVVTWIFRIADIGAGSLENIKTEVVSSLESVSVSGSIMTNNFIEGTVSGKSLTTLSCNISDENSHSITHKDRLDEQPITITTKEIDKEISNMSYSNGQKHIEQLLTETSDLRQVRSQLEGDRNVVR